MCKKIRFTDLPRLSKRIKVFCFFFSKKKALLLEKRRIAEATAKAKALYPFRGINQ
jgi:hypothetical protein